MKFLISTNAPHHWVKLSSKDAVLEKGQFSEADFMAAVSKGATSIIAVVPGEQVTLHSVAVPTNRQANMLAAVPYALEEKLSEDIDNLHFSVLDWQAGKDAQVAVVSKQTVNSVLALFGDAASRLDGMVPDYAFLPLHANGGSTVVRATAERYLVKQGAFDAMVMDPYAFEYWWQSVDVNKNYAVNDRDLVSEMQSSGGENVSLWDIGTNFTHWLEHAPTPDLQKYSLLRAAYEPEHLKPKNTLLNWAVGLAAGALLFLGGSNWFELEQLKKQHQANEAEIKALFAATFPEQEYLDQPKRQIAALLSIDLSGSPSEQFQYLLEKASVAAPQNQASFLEINYRNQALQIGVTAPNFAALEQMTAQLDSAQGIRAALVSSSSRGDTVRGQIKLIVGDS